MSDASAVSPIESLMKVLEASAEVTGKLIVRVRDAEDEAAALREQVAELGRRVAALEARADAAAPTPTLGVGRFRTLDELAAELRAEFSDELAEVTARIDNVHERALRALTNMQERKSRA